MRTRSTLTALLLIAMLAGCGGAQSPALPQVASANGQAQSGSWMLPEASSEDLLYIADAGEASQAAVDVFAYPSLKRVGKLTNGYRPFGECLDKAQAVYVVYGSELVEYAHGATKPTRTIQGPSKSDESYNWSCAVDGATGNLAVTTQGYGGSGDVYIYVQASGQPAGYYADLWTPAYLTYDSSGNLFVLGGAASSGEVAGVAELRPRESAFRRVHFAPKQEEHIYPLGGVFWYGNRLVLGLVEPDVAQYKIRGKHDNWAFQTGETPLPGAGYYHTGFWIEGDRLVQTAGCNTQGCVFLYTYPGGVKVRGLHGFDEPLAALVSRANSNARIIHVKSLRSWSNAGSSD